MIIYIYTYIDTYMYNVKKMDFQRYGERKKERKKERKRERQRDRWGERERGRQADT